MVIVSAEYILRTIPQTVLIQGLKSVCKTMKNPRIDEIMACQYFV